MKITAVLFILFLSSSLSTSNAQGIKLGLGLGLTNFTGPDAITNNISDAGFAFSSELHIGAKAKLSIPLFPLTPVAFVQYTMAGGEGTIGGSKIETSMNILSVGAGAEMSLAPGFLSPYLAVDIAYNNLGDLEIEAPESAGGNRTLDGSSRMGLGVGAGAEVSLILITLDVSAKYHLYNLFGKESGEETISAVVVNLSALF